MKAKKTVLQQLEEEAERERYELHLLRDIRAVRLPTPERHARWHPTVDYEADLLFRREFLIVEVDGGTYIPYGHHNFGDGYEYDRIRDAEALTLGFIVLRVTPAMVKSGTAVGYVERVLHAILAKRGSHEKVRNVARIDVTQLPTPEKPKQASQPRRAQPRRARKQRTV